jgi:hypothetical protein
MKYIRLTSTDPNAVFNNQFNEPLNVKPNSKIALEGISFDVKPTLITLDATNDGLIYRHSDTFGGIAGLDNRTYDKENVSNLFLDMTDKLNSIYGQIVDIRPSPPVFLRELDEERTLFGYEIKVFQDVDKNTNINISQGAFIGFSEVSAYYKTANIEVDGVFSITFGRTDAVSDVGQYLSPRSPIAKGCGLMRTSIDLQEQDPTADKGLIMGLVANNPQNVAPANEDAIDYYIHIRSNPNTILLKTPAGIVDTGIQVNTETGADADTFDIITLGKKILFVQYNNTLNTTTYLGAFEYDNSVEYYGIYNPRSSNQETLFKNAFFTTSPFFGLEDLNENVQVLDESNLGATPAPLPSKNNTNKFLAMSRPLSQFLGYENFLFPTQGSFFTQDLSLVSENQLLTNISQSYLIELLNIEIDSYDGLTNQRQNILSVIPQLPTDEGAINYNSSTLIYIDMKNTQDLALRNIRARILDKNLNPISVSGLSVITLVIV